MMKRRIALLLSFVYLLLSLGLYVYTNESYINTVNNISILKDEVAEQKVMNNINSQTASLKDDSIYKGVNLEELQHQEELLMYKNKVFSTNKDELRSIIYTYIKNRYNYSGKEIEDYKGKVLKKIKPYTSEYLYNKESEALSSTKELILNNDGNIVNSASVEDVYFEPSYKQIKGPSDNTKIDYYEAYCVSAIVKVNQNKSNLVYYNFYFTNTLDKPNWIIDDIDTVANRFAKEEQL